MKERIIEQKETFVEKKRKVKVGSIVYRQCIPSLCFAWKLVSGINPTKRKKRKRLSWKGSESQRGCLVFYTYIRNACLHTGCERKKKESGLVEREADLH
jgi:hypothetical protein